MPRHEALTLHIKGTKAMRTLAFFDPDTRQDILDHISGYIFDRAVIAFSDEPMRPLRHDAHWTEREPARVRRARSVRR